MLLQQTLSFPDEFGLEGSMFGVRASMLPRACRLQLLALKWQLRHHANVICPDGNLANCFRVRRDVGRFGHVDSAMHTKRNLAVLLMFRRRPYGGGGGGDQRQGAPPTPCSMLTL